MTISLLILGLQLIIGLPEIIISLLVALALGFSIHFFWTSRKSIVIEQPSASEPISDNDNWKLKYYNDMDMQERAQQQLREKLSEACENEQILTIELEESRKMIDEMANEKPEPVAGTEKREVAETSGDYLLQLKSAQQNLAEQNNNIARLLEQIEKLKEAEKKNADLQKVNEQLNAQFAELQKTITNKENEILGLRQQQRLTTEIADRLDKAYSEFNTLQDKLQKLDSYLAQSHKSGEHAELQESYFRLTKDYDDIKSRHGSVWEENQRLSRILSDTEDKLREANFQRQQLQKKVAFMEELNNDLQQVSEHNNKLESQLRRISEMEALLANATQNAGDFHKEPGL